MAEWLKQSTSGTKKIGPFLDSTDGVTPETGLTITQPDIRLTKNGGAFAQKAAAQTLTHDENGYYGLTLDATDRDTLGLLTVNVNKTGALPVWHDFMIVPANVWDSMFGSDKLDVSLVQWLGTAAATPTVAGVPEVDVTHLFGTILAEGGAGRLAAAFNKLFDVVTPVLVASDVMVGTDGANTDKTGYALSTAGILAIWHQLNSAIATAGSMGKLLKDEVTAARMAVLTDLINGGRLDLLIDAIKAVTDKFVFTVANIVDANMLRINGNANAAIRLALSAGQIIPFTVDTVVNTHTPTTTEFQADDITEATADHFGSRPVYWTSGALAGQTTDIINPGGYSLVGGIGQFTVTAMTEAPANNDTGIIV